jgi:hypothetical protein
MKFFGQDVEILENKPGMTCQGVMVRLEKRPLFFKQTHAQPAGAAL